VIRAKGTFWIGYWVSSRPSLDMVGRKQSPCARNGTPLKLCYSLYTVLGNEGNGCVIQGLLWLGIYLALFSEGHFFYHHGSLQFWSALGSFCCIIRLLLVTPCPPLCGAVLLEKLPGSQLAKKFPAFYGTLRFITAFTIACHLSLS